MLIRKLMPAAITALGEDEVEVTISTGAIARDGHVFEPQGAQLDNYLKNPIVLWQHDPEQPVGKAEEIRVEGDAIKARIRFAPPGISAKADEIRGLVKSGIVSGVSVGMEPIDSEPLDPRKGSRGGLRISSWELLETSFCSVPVDTNAGVTARSQRKEQAMTDGTKGGARALKLRRGLYDVAVLASVLDQLDGCCDMAEWEASMEGDGSEVPAMLSAALQKFGAALIAMTQEEVAELLSEPKEDGEALAPYGEGALASSAGTSGGRALRFRAALVRAKSNAAMQDQMQAVDGHISRGFKHHRALGEHQQAVGDGLAKVRALHAKASEAVTNAHEALAAAKGGASDGSDGTDSGVNAEGSGKRAKDTKDAPAPDAGAVEEATKQVSRAHRALKTAAGHLGQMADEHATMDDRHQDSGDAANGVGRSMKSAQRSLRSLLDASNSGNEADDGKDVDSHKMQNVEGDSEDVEDEGGTSKSKRAADFANGHDADDHDFRRRQAEMLSLTDL